MSAPARRGAGFTLLEVLAVVFLTSIVMGLALDFYVDLSRNTARATAHTREIRRATAILDRLARDFERTVLLRKAPEEDPLNHPWVFVAESRSSGLGADHVKFPTLNHEPRGSRTHEADFAMVAYVTRAGFDEGVELLRWSSPHLPESLDRDFPLPDDERVLLLADGLAGFGVRFLNEAGEWADSWDSSTLLDSGELPLAVEIEVAIVDEERVFGEEDVARFSRMVVLPLRPLDPTDLTGESPEEGAEAAEGEEALELPPELESLLTPEMREALQRGSQGP